MLKPLKIALVSTLLLAVGTASAAPPKKLPTPPVDDQASAKAFYDAGTKAYNLGDFAKAIENYKAAYNAVAEPVFLYNIAQSYRLWNNLGQALFFYKSYLRNMPGASNRVEVEGRIREIDAQLAKQKQTVSQPPNDPVPPGGDAAAPEPVVPADVPPPAVDPPPAADVAVVPAVADVPAPRRPGRGLRIAGLVTMGAGVVLVAGGVLFGVQASSLSDEVSGLGMGDTWDPGREDDGRAAERNMYICYGVGGAALIGGGVMYYLGRKAGRSRDAVTLAPTLAPRVAGLALSGTF